MEIAVSSRDWELWSAVRTKYAWARERAELRQPILIEPFGACDGVGKGDASEEVIGGSTEDMNIKCTMAVS